MFPNGLSVLTHLFILIIAFSKRLVEFVAEKMKWDIFNFKMNLYFDWKIAKPLTSQAGDNAARRIFSFLIILAVFAMVASGTTASFKTALGTKSNIGLVKEMMVSGYAQAKEKVETVLAKNSITSEIILAGKESPSSQISEVRAYTLPLSENVDINYPISQ